MRTTAPQDTTRSAMRATNHSSTQKESFTWRIFFQKCHLHPVWTLVCIRHLDCSLLLKNKRGSMKSIGMIPCLIDVLWWTFWSLYWIRLLNGRLLHMIRWLSFIKSWWKKCICDLLFFCMPGFLLLRKTETEKMLGKVEWKLNVMRRWHCFPVWFLCHDLLGYWSSFLQHMLTWFLSECGSPSSLPSSL